jgi:Tfp pilus assembly protein PilX
MQKKTQRPGLNHQAGQVGIIVLLISAIILVIALSIANRVVKESQGNIAAENSTRVFNTAASGVQQALANIF